MKKKSIWKHVSAISAGTVLGLGIAAVGAALVGLNRWAKDEDSDSIRIVFGKKGIMIRKNTETGKYEVDTNYDWKSDPEFCDDDEDIFDSEISCVEVKKETTVDTSAMNSDSATKED